jgi:hypothetical protein
MNITCPYKNSGVSDCEPMRLLAEIYEAHAGGWKDWTISKAMRWSLVVERVLDIKAKDEECESE